MSAALVTGLIGCLLAQTSALAQDQPLGVDLMVANELPFDRVGEPVTCGVPLARGFARSEANLGLRGPDGRPVPVQISTTSTYHDGTPRWVLLRFLADVPAQGKAAYSLVPGRPETPRVSLACALTDGTATIDTGVARFAIDTRRFHLLDSAVVGGKELIAPGGGAFLERAQGAGTLPGDSVTSARFEEQGPLCAVLCLRGQIGPGAPLPLADWVCRLQFQAGTGEVWVSYTLHNPAAQLHPGNVWDLGSGGSVYMEDFSLLLPPAPNAWDARVGVGAGEAPLAATGLYQDSSGGPNLRSGRSTMRVIIPSLGTGGSTGSSS